MPTPIGHALAALTIATAARSSVRAPGLVYFMSAGVLGCLPDAELLITVATGYRGLHHGPFHTVAFAAVVGSMAAFAAPAGWGSRRALFLIAFACVASHLLLDLMRATHPASGLQVLWPFSERRFSLPLHVFHHAPSFAEATTPGGFRLLMRNVTTELLILGPMLFLAWLWTGPLSESRGFTR